jgi:excisionase family DNA binding protein
MTDWPKPSGTPAYLYTTAEAAELLRMSAEWLKKQAWRGQVPCVRMGRSVRFTDAQLNEIIAAHERPVLRGQGGQRGRL